MNQPSIRYTRVRKVKDLVRANVGDAGLDFFFPEDLTVKEFMEKPNGELKQAEQVVKTYGFALTCKGKTWNIGSQEPIPFTQDDVIESITIHPKGRILIPSGIRVLITPQASMLMAANKSGVCTKTGLIFGAEIVDSPYTGEVHISVINTSASDVTLEAGKKVVQFIHVPIFDTEPEEIPSTLYEKIAEKWGTRGDKAFGSSDDQVKQPELPLDYEEEISIRDAQYSV